MHRSVLQNEDYIKFAGEKTVEVMAMQRLDEGISKQDPKAATYKTKDAKGREVEYLVEFPGMTVEEINNLNRSKAGQYNDTGKIPFTAIVNPHTLKKMRGFSGSKSAKALMDAVETAMEELQAEHGPSLSRGKLKEFDEIAATVREVLEKKGAAKGLTEFKKLDKFVKKLGPKMQKMADEVKAELTKAAGAELDKAEELLDEGDVAGAKKILGGLKRVLKKTELEGRVNELMARTKPAEK
jgi:hypothetical protein